MIKELVNKVKRNKLKNDLNETDKKLEEAKKDLNYRIDMYKDYLTNDEYDLPDNLRSAFTTLIVSLNEEVDTINSIQLKRAEMSQYIR